MTQQISSTANYVIENVSQARVEVPEVRDSKDKSILLKRQILGIKADSKLVGALPYTITVTGKVLAPLSEDKVFLAMVRQGLLKVDRSGGVIFG